MLAQALTLDGARYATPYNFVRALRRRTIRAASPSHADAVQLLTVHGAKGLEAQVVFVMDADPEPKNPDTATLLVEWPVEAEAPRRCAFVYAESACPPSLQGLFAAELEARQREELNGLYVAMSRARQRLVFSATEPSRRAGAAPWWARVEPRAGAGPGALGMDGRGADVIAAPITAPLTAPPRLLTLAFTPRAAPERRPARAPDTDATRLGQAVHRALEWSASRDEAAWDELAHGAALEFDAPPAAVASLARTILRSPEAARFFVGPQLGWAGNEVPVSAAGEALRIDRLVRLDAPGGAVWWVLDYKLSHAPEQLDDYRAQLLRYRDAVRSAQPGATVRCAFVTGSGAVREID